MYRTERSTVFLVLSIRCIVMHWLNLALKFFLNPCETWAAFQYTIHPSKSTRRDDSLAD